jgi:ATP-dependent DNA helicase PIF1
MPRGLKRIAPDDLLSKRRRIADENDALDSTEAEEIVEEVVEDRPLSEEQQWALKMVLNCIDNKKHCFVTGCAGVGKSRLLEAICENLGDKEYAIVAPTASASSNITGVTYHSFFGIEIEKRETEMKKLILKKLKKIKESPNDYPRVNVSNVKILIFDEVSLISGEMLENLSRIMHSIRDGSAFGSFGDIAVVFFGDFLQLPPIDGKMAFMSNFWKNHVKHAFELEQVQRQKGRRFVEVLNRIRVGDIDNATQAYIRLLQGNPETRNISFSEEKPECKNFNPTYMYSTLEEARKRNLEKFNEIPGPSKVYRARDYNPKNIRYEWRVQKEIELKVGAKVMLQSNLTDTLYNGLCGYVKELLEDGVVVDFPKEKGKYIGFSIFELKDGYRVLATRTALPLALGYAWTFHKSQGLTLTEVVIDGRRVFAPGQIYVGLSRCKDPHFVQFLNFNKDKIKCDPDALEYYKSDKIQRFVFVNQRKDAN